MAKQKHEDEVEQGVDDSGLDTEGVAATESPQAADELNGPAQPAAASVTVKAELNEGSVTIKTKDDVSGVADGASVSGEGIAPGTTVARVGNGGVVLSQAALKTGTDVDVRLG